MSRRAGRPGPIFRGCLFAVVSPPVFVFMWLQAHWPRLARAVAAIESEARDDE